MELNSNEFNKLIEQAKQDSKDNFLSFAKGIYGLDEQLYGHLWKVPIIEQSDYRQIITSNLSTKSETEIEDIVKAAISQEIGEAESVFVGFDKFYTYFTDDEIEEYKAKRDEGSIKENSNAVIVYSKTKLEKRYLDIKNGGQCKSKEQIDEKFLKYVSKIFMHERTHLLVNILECDSKTLDEYYINGAEVPVDKMIKDKVAIFGKDNESFNEAFVDIFAKMVTMYEEKDTIESCLYKVVEETMYGDFEATDNDKEILKMYILFPQELTDWAMFGAYDDVHVNILEQKMRQLNEVSNGDARDYFNKIGKKGKTKEQIELTEKMLDSLCYPSIKKENLKTVASSSNALLGLYEKGYSIQSIRQAIFDEYKKRGDK